MATNMVLSGIVKRTGNPLWLVLLAASVLMACPHAHALQVELSTEVQGDLRPTIRAATNLPDGMKLLVRVTRKESAFQFETPVRRCNQVASRSDRSHRLPRISILARITSKS